MPVNATEPRKLGNLERLWAYLTIQQLLEEQEIVEATTPQNPGNPDPESTQENTTAKPQIQPKEEALKIALKVSSLQNFGNRETSFSICSIMISGWCL